MASRLLRFTVPVGLLSLAITVAGGPFEAQAVSAGPSFASASRASSPSPASGDQCSAPQADRVGGWACITSESASPATGTGWCYTTGNPCWTVNTSTRAQWNFYYIAYGYGDTLIGSVQESNYHNTNGDQVQDTQYWQSTSTESPVEPSQAIYLYNGTTGAKTEDPDSYIDSSWGTVVGGVTVHWTTSSYPGVYHGDDGWRFLWSTVTWYDPVFPGSWTISVASALMYRDHERTTVCEFADKIPDNAVSVSWDWGPV